MPLRAEQTAIVEGVENRRRAIKSQALNAARTLVQTSGDLAKFIVDNQSDYDEIYGDGDVDGGLADAGVDVERDEANGIIETVVASSLITQTREELEHMVNPGMPGLP